MQLRKRSIIQKELEELKNLPPLPPREQEIIDVIGKAMADRALEDLALGIHRKPLKRKK